ncbi:SufD family Fe-S cluster assembly protein [bacterium]|nr:SufD family Fe-S cluster assembly protein [bacterium]
MSKDLSKLAGIDDVLHDPETAHLMINLNKVLSRNDIPGIEIWTEELTDGVSVRMVVKRGIVVKKPVHLCFGITHRQAVQRILMDIIVEDGAKIDIFSHCIFPYGGDIKHIMNATAKIGRGANYSYIERHIHSPKGGIFIDTKTRVSLGEDARYKSDFELLRGRVGEINLDYEAECDARSVVEMTTKISGSGDDIIKTRETAYLVGEHSTGVLNSRIAVKDEARAEVYNKLVARAAYARGHVDCKEIVQGKGSAQAIPIVEVAHPKAHITHEAAIGSVDTKQLETLMARGLSEEEAVDLIVSGLLGA